MTESREAARKRAFRDRQRSVAAAGGPVVLPDQPTRMTTLCIVLGCLDARAIGQLCRRHARETDP
ncbi:hypothetical protein FDO65_10025 [Nakamurella flava]|uniref:Uncharacterized protein n=1 Tax=Nakamurella flava TaxID=2576308 RepID=A0A4U6QMJ3_9ACTN|nr:hypothetical protein [Nakamurella flava]TKV61854.1 hypothetical protein FDO65_10025 [Nakamurella flava]